MNKQFDYISILAGGICPMKCEFCVGQFIRKNKNPYFADIENIKIFLEFFPFLIKKMGNSPKELIELLLKDFNFNIFVIGGDYSMEKFQKSYFKISDYEDLIPLLKKEDDHINLYLAEEANLS